jgi:hypothetical protein
MALTTQGGSYGDGLTEVLMVQPAARTVFEKCSDLKTLTDGFAALARISCVLSSRVVSGLSGIASCHEDERSGIHTRQVEDCQSRPHSA